MKKLVMNFALLAISISMVTMFVCSSVASAQTGSKLIYDMKENVETIFTLNENGKYLTPKLKYEYERNNNGDVINKKAYRWNSVNEKWIPYYLITYTKINNDLTLEFAQWDNKKQSFSQNIQKAIYSRDADNVLFAHQAYNWNQSKKIWDLNNQLISQNYLATAKNLK